MSKLPRLFVVLVIPLLIVGAGAAGAAKLISSRAAPQKVDHPDRGVLVETMKVERATQTVEVEAKGAVTAAKRLVAHPQVTGQVTWINEGLVPGGLIAAGEPLFRVSSRDYKLAVDQRQTAVDQAQAQLRIEHGQQRVAKKEWELFRDQVGADQDPSLALRQPQMKVAEVNVEAAKSMLERAKLDLSRTTVRAPFNLMVDSENLEVGQVVGPTSAAATVVGTDQFWVQVAVPMDRLDFIRVPGINAQEGSEVAIVQTIGKQRVQRKGRVARLLGELDPVGRMARVLVEIEDPLNLATADGTPRGLPLLLGAYVTVEFGGATEMSVVEIPRIAVREGNQVWVYADGKLDIREVTIAWNRDQTTLVDKGLDTGDEIVTSRIPTPLPGMKLRKGSDAGSSK